MKTRVRKKDKERTRPKDKNRKRRKKQERDELFMSCPRRGQLWPIDTH